MNLESEIYRLSFELSEAIDKNDIQKLLGVLASDGVYAMWVYATEKLDKNKKERMEYIIKETNKFVGTSLQNDNIDHQYFQQLAQDLEKLLFMKDLLEKIFIYALYHAKAKKGTKDEVV